MTKKKNPQDTTMRNARAAKKRDDATNRRISELESVVNGLCQTVDAMFHAGKKKR